MYMPIELELVLPLKFFLLIELSRKSLGRVTGLAKLPAALRLLFSREQQLLLSSMPAVLDLFRALDLDPHS